MIMDGVSAVFNFILAAFGWMQQIIEKSGLNFGLFIVIIICFLALDFFVTFIRMQSIGGMYSDGSMVSAREGKVGGVKGFRVKK